MKRIQPKRHWYQFSLRTLLLAMFVASIPMGRIAYLQQMAAHHRYEEHRVVLKLAEIDGYNRLAKSESSEVIAAFVSGELETLADGGSTAKVLSGWPGASLFAGRSFIPVDDEQEVELWVTAIHERQLSERYERTIWRPWQFVNEPPRLEISYGRR